MTQALSRCLHTAPGDEAKLPETHAQSQTRALCCVSLHRRKAGIARAHTAVHAAFAAGRPHAGAPGCGPGIGHMIGFGEHLGCPA
jgi:hypothetical protein